MYYSLPLEEKVSPMVTDEVDVYSTVTVPSSSTVIVIPFLT